MFRKFLFPSAMVLLIVGLLAALAGSAQAQTIIIDNSDGAPNFITTGNDWASWGTAGYGFNGSDSDYLYLSHTVGGADRRGSAIWSPDIPTAGTYRIATWFRRTSNRTSDADYFVMDGNGEDRHVVVNQRGSGASGWVSLGTSWCAEGRDGCRVILNGSDDDHSDEANAVRFQLVEADSEPPPPLEPEVPCTWPGWGDHTQEAFATVVSGSDWTQLERATGAPDGRGAHTPNMDDGELFKAGGWSLCDPWGDWEEITSVRLSVRARTQYEAGTYDIFVRLDGGGLSERIWHDTGYRWHTVDLTSEMSVWTWEDVADIRARLTLHSHPGGRRDSDVWADSFRLRVGYSMIPSGELRDEGDEPDDGVEQEPEPSECDGDCVETSDWWWNDAGDGANANDAPADDVDELDGYQDPDDAPPVDEEEEPDGDDDVETDDDDDDDLQGSDPSQFGGFEADGSAFSGETGCGAGLQTATLLPLLPLAFGGLGLRRRRRKGDREG